MRVLVTGCAGFIGASVAARLLAEHDVVGVDSMNDAYDVRLKEWRLAQLPPERFRFVRADVADRDAMARLFDEHRFDAVVNLAARAGVRPSIDAPAEYLRTNVEGTLVLLELCRRRDVRTFAFASSSSVYGDRNPRPFREDCDTDHPLSPYAASKKSAELLGATYAHLHGIDVAALRFFTVYGPAGRPDMAPFRFIRWIAEGEPVVLYGDGSHERDFTYVDDIARGVVSSLRVRGYEAINLGNDRPATVSQLIDIVEKAVGRPARIERRSPSAADVPKTWADITRARRLLGWQPTVGLEEGVARAAEWYLANRSWAKDLRLGAS